MMRPIIVMPCLNEQELLAATCKSLGFGLGATRTPEDCLLVLVDNGSNDDTLGVMHHVRDRSPAGSVHIVQETEQGYVPARHRGTLAASELAKTHSIAQRDLLVIQADADTQYYDGYISEIRRTAEGQGDFIVRGTSLYDLDFRRAHSGFLSLLEKIDRPIERFIVDDADEVIVSDHVSAYSLASYFAWGGHVREYNGSGEEIYAETSRLLIKAILLGGCRLLRASKAIAYHSRRKTLSEPLLEFASAGFPRERSWRDRFRRECGRSIGIDQLDRAGIESKIQHPIFLRRSHSIVLFNVLPQLVAARSGRNELLHEYSDQFKELTSVFEHLRREDILANTARLFEAAFSMIDARSDAL